MSINLRSNLNEFPGFLYSGAIALNFDIPIFSDIFSLYNPIGNTKIINIIAGTFSARSDGQSRNITVNFSSGVKTVVGTTVIPTKLNTDSPSNSAELNFGGTWNIGTRIESRNLITDGGTLNFDLNIISPIILKPGEGVLFYMESESGSQIFLPSASLVWYEV